MQAAIRQTNAMLCRCMTNLAIKAANESRAARLMDEIEDMEFFDHLERRLHTALASRFTAGGRRR